MLFYKANQFILYNAFTKKLCILLKIIEIAKVEKVVCQQLRNFLQNRLIVL
jgi:hypothetical protein